MLRLLLFVTELPGRPWTTKLIFFWGVNELLMNRWDIFVIELVPCSFVTLPPVSESELLFSDLMFLKSIYSIFILNKTWQIATIIQFLSMHSFCQRLGKPSVPFVVAPLQSACVLTLTERSCHTAPPPWLSNLP